MIVRVFAEGLPHLAPQWQALLAFVAVTSMVVGNLGAIAQNSTKRLLAYSGVAQAGYILVGVVAGGRWGLAAVLFYLFSYLFMNFGAFAVVTLLAGPEGDRDQLSDLDGLGYRQPLLGLAMTVFMLSLAGFPPTVGFIGKFFLFTAAVASGYTWLVVIAVLMSVVSVSYYFRVLAHVWTPPAGPARLSLSLAPAVTVGVSAAVHDRPARRRPGLRLHPLASVRAALPKHFRPHLGGLPAEVEAAWYTDGASAPAAAVGAEVLWLAMWARPAIEAALEAGPGVRWVNSHAAGVDRHPLDLYLRRGIQLTNGAGLHAVPISEYVVLGILAAAKAFPALVRAQDRAEWLQRPPGRGELHGSRALVVGYGQIGRAIAERLRAFGVHVVGARRHSSEEPDVVDSEGWRGRLGEFDWVVLATPLTGETRHLIGPTELAAMKPGAWLVNISRGSLVDHDALLGALQDGAIAGAYLDVTDPEPLPAESELWRLPNVILTPHSSWASERFEERAAALFLDNLERYRQGRPLRNLVDLEAGY
jgi:phosphoglycerate dehydrogenase-like enzyme